MFDFDKISEVALAQTESFGATYADIRVVHTRDENITVKNGIPELIDRSETLGFGIRVIAGACWGFASSCELTPDSVKRVSELAVRIALASSKVKNNDVVLSPVESTKDTYKTKVKIDPFEISLKEKLDYHLSLYDLTEKIKGLRNFESFMSFRKEKRYFASSEGSKIEQEITHSGAGISALALRSHREMGRRSYPNSSGEYQARGYELIEGLRLEENTEKVAEQAKALLDAKSCPTGVKTIILDGAQVSLQIHESIGHPLELDRVFGAEKNFSGTSFATVDKLGELKYASDIVSVVTDPTYPGGLGTFGYDDEGVKARKSYLLKDGVLVGYLASREAAAKVGKESNASMRAQGWGDVPIIRMTNTNLLPGKYTLEDLISEVDDGIYMETVSSWSIDDNRENFKMGTEIGWEIKKGKLKDMIKNPTYSGNTMEFWKSCDGICNEKYWRVWGTPNCGKGQPPQNMRVGQGASPCRFRGIKVGE